MNSGDGAQSSLRRNVNVLIASPSDVVHLREAVELAIYRISNERFADRGIALLPRLWELDSVPQQGSPQDVLNQQLLPITDIVIALFHTKLGSPTTNAVSGTVEEIQLAIGQGKRVMIYFSDELIRPTAIDQSQLSKLGEFKNWCRANSLYSSFDDKMSLLSTISRDLPKAVEALIEVERKGQPRSLVDKIPAAKSRFAQKRMSAITEPTQAAYGGTKLKADPKNDFELGLRLARSGDLDEAMSVFERVIRQGGSATTVGNTFRMLNEPERAIDAFRLGANLGDGEAASHLGIELSMQGQKLAAAAAFRRAIDLGFRHPHINLEWLAAKYFAEAGR